MKSYIIFDRDGTLIQHRHHLIDATKIEHFQDSIKALNLVKVLGFSFGIVSNQSVISRGMATIEEVEAINLAILKHFSKVGIDFEFVLICPHAAEDNCPCRKPKTGLILKLPANIQIDYSRSFMIGDQESDVLFGLSLGLQTILLGKGQDRTTLANFQSESLWNASILIHRMVLGDNFVS